MRGLVERWRSRDPNLSSGTAAAVSSHVDWYEAEGRLGACFVPDVEAFPYVGRAEPYKLLGVVQDLATAFPDCRFELADERAGTRVAFQLARGCADRLPLEAGARGFGRLLRFTGERDGVACDVALAWCDGNGLQVVAVVNGQRSPNGGSHVQGVWEGVADALNARVRAEGIRCREVTLMDVPRNAVLVVSVHLDGPRYGPATKDCLHDERARQAIRSLVAEHFFTALGEDAARAGKPPWQLLGGFHNATPWLPRLADELYDDGRPGDRDPFHHHPGDKPWLESIR